MGPSRQLNWYYHHQEWPPGSNPWSPLGVTESCKEVCLIEKCRGKKSRTLKFYSSSFLLDLMYKEFGASSKWAELQGLGKMQTSASCLEGSMSFLLLQKAGNFRTSSHNGTYRQNRLNDHLPRWEIITEVLQRRQRTELWGIWHKCLNGILLVCSFGGTMHVWVLYTRAHASCVCEHALRPEYMLCLP